MFGVMAQQTIAHRVECARPGEPLRNRRRFVAELVVEGVAHDFIRATLHLDRRATGEREHEDARRIGAAHGEVCDSMRERVGLARACAGNDQQRTCAEALPTGKRLAIGHSLALRSIETCEFFARGHHLQRYTKGG
jgi:hypothetical protein